MVPSTLSRLHHRRTSMRRTGDASLVARLRRSPWGMVIFVVAMIASTIGMSALASAQGNHVSAYRPAAANTAVTTSKNDLARTGQNNNETFLNTSTVNVNQFGKRVSYPVDGQVYAQPLYIPNLNIGGSLHNVVFVETEHDSVYAFDADQTSAIAPLWHTSFLSNGVTTVSNTDVSCNDIVPEYGITGTPVIDLTTNTMYVVANTNDNGTITYRLHALDITTGLDKAGSPVVITASVPGTGAGSSNGVVNFLPQRQHQRGGLLLMNGTIYIDFGSHCDDYPYHGWVMGYNASSLHQVTVYNSTPNGAQAGIWQNGEGLSADSNGNIYLATGNGTFDLDQGKTEAGDSVLKLSTQNGLSVADYFTPFNQSCLEAADADLGSGGVLQVPGSNMLINAGKEGRIYVMNKSNMGHYNTIAQPCNNQSRTDVDKVVQELPPGTIGGMFSTPAYWNSPSGAHVYFTGTGDHAKAFSFSNGLLSTTPTSQTPESFGFTGGNASISSNGSTAGTGILWIIDPSAVLRAYDATNLATELYNSGQNSSRDGLDSYVKFTVPTIANGEVFVGTKTTLTIFGPLSSTPTPTPSPTQTSTPTPSPTITPTPPPVSYNNAGISDDSNPAGANYDHSGNSYSVQALQGAGINPGDHVFFNNFVFVWPSVVAGANDNYEANGQVIPVTPVAKAKSIGFLGSATNGSASGTVTLTYTDGTTQTFTLGFADWVTLPPAFKNSVVTTMPYRNTASGKQAISTSLFETEFVLKWGKTLQSVTLPATVTGGQLHVFSISTKATYPLPTYNNKGTSNDGNGKSANYDGAGNSYSAQALQASGINPGKFVVFNGVTFTWPRPYPGNPNNYAVDGQVVPVTPGGSATTLALLGSSTGGPSSGTATITYTDGTTQTFTLDFSDWTLTGGGGTVSSDNSVVATMSYRNTSSGAGKEMVTTYVFYYQVALQSGKTVKSVTLPTTVNQGQLHVFAVATK